MQKLRTRVLSTMLTLFIACIAGIAAAFALGLMVIGATIAKNAETIGNDAATHSNRVMEQQLKPILMKLAENTATIIEENLMRVEYSTQILAGSIANLYAHSENYHQRVLPLISNGVTPRAFEPYLHMSPGINLDRIRSETGLVANCADIMEYLGNSTPQVLSFFVAGESGYIIAMDRINVPSLDYAAAQRPWYRLAHQNNALTWTDLYEDARGRGFALACAAPVFDSFSGRKQFKGVAGCNISIKGLEKIISDSRIWDNYHTTPVFLLDRAGRKLFASDGSGVRIGANGVLEYEDYLANENYRVFAERMINGEDGFLAIPEENGQADFVAYHPLNRLYDRLGWSVGVYFDCAEISAQMQRLRKNISSSMFDMQSKTNSIETGLLFIILFVTLAAITIAIIFMFRFTKSLTKPVVELTDAVERFGGGADITANISTNVEEIERLNRAFNNMRMNFAAHIGNISKSKRLAAELTAAGSIQTALLPRSFAEGGKKVPFDIAALTQNAQEIGGGFYDFFFIDEQHLAVIISDGCGTGIPAALMMAVVKTMLNTYLKQPMRLDAAFNEVNRELCERQRGKTVAVWAGVFDLTTRVMQFVNAGHLPPLVRSGASRSVALPPPANPPLGSDAQTAYSRAKLTLSAGSILFLFTGGAAEARNSQGEPYSIAKLSALLDENAARSMKEIVSIARDSIALFRAESPQTSDIALLALRPRD